MQSQPKPQRTPKKLEFKELPNIRQELVRADVEALQNRSPVIKRWWTEFSQYLQRITNWCIAVELMLESDATYRQLVMRAPLSPPLSSFSCIVCVLIAVLCDGDLQLTARAESDETFPFITTAARTALDKRLAAVKRWIPKEKAALTKRYRYSALIKLLLERVVECGKTTTQYTAQIKREIERVEEWQARMTDAIQNKAKIDVFKKLHAEVADGPNRVLVDGKELKTIEQYTKLYCLCQSEWVEGVFMIGTSLLSVFAWFSLLIWGGFHDWCWVCRM